MIEAKEKAKELFNKMYNCELDISYYAAKECAKIAQESILKKLKDLNIKDSFEEEVLFEINVI